MVTYFPLGSLTRSGSGCFKYASLEMVNDPGQSCRRRLVALANGKANKMRLDGKSFLICFGHRNKIRIPRHDDCNIQLVIHCHCQHLAGNGDIRLLFLIGPHPSFQFVTPNFLFSELSDMDVSFPGS